MSWHTCLGRKNIAVAALAVALVASLPAQTVRPVIVQYSGVARGKFELVNNGLRPMSVVLEPMSFSITEDGDGVYGPLASSIHLKLSETSFRIPPQQSRFVFYEAHSDNLPAWFVIRNVFSGSGRRYGIKVQVDIPHTVYILQKQPLEKQDVVVESFKHLRRQRKVVVTLMNQSSKLGRALEWQVSAKGTKTSNAGFPLLPQSRRRLEVEWNSPDAPAKFSVRFERFTLREELSAQSE